MCARPQYGLKLYPVVLGVVNVFSYISLLVRATVPLENVEEVKILHPQTKFGDYIVQAF